MKKLTSKFYLVGIKGTGMSSLAKLLKNSGYEVIGSDTKDYYFTEDSLISLGINILEFDERNITDEYFYIIGNAYDCNNIEVNEIINNHFEFLYYHDFIGKKLNKKIVACCGTHGKTTTSYFLTKFLNKECNYIIGDGQGDYYDSDLLVLEACEYKNHFLSYNPELLIITNIEMDHTDYYKNKKQLITSFQGIANNSKMILINGDDKNVKKIKHQNKLTYGFNKDNDIKIKILSTTSSCYYVQVNYLKNYYLRIPYLGKHMIYNYVSAYIATILLNKKPKNLNDSNLPKKRFTKYSFKESILIDDYAHHPTEINALHETIRLTYPDAKIYVIFQPHTYERTLYFKKAFLKALEKFDQVYIMEVFTSKREKRNDKLQKKVDTYFKKFTKIEKLDYSLIGKENSVWLFLGAGLAGNMIMEIKNENK